MKTLLALAMIGGCTATKTAPVGAVPQDGTRWVWIEAESTSNSNFGTPEQNPFAPANPTEAAILSGGKWIGAEVKGQMRFAEYAFNLKTAGTYEFFARKFWQHGPYRWQVDGGEWHGITSQVALLDEAELRQFTVANWTHGGQVKLGAGSHRLRIESTAKDGAIAFDAFLFTLDPFTPRGKLKPGEKYNRAPEGYFAFEPDPDPFKPSAIDLRSLNEAYAGEHGFLAAKGEELVRSGNGQPVRFWAHNTGHDALLLDDSSLALFARSLAKQGVNLIRVHGPALSDQDWTKADPAKIRQVQRFVQAMKKEGIYTSLSIYFPLWFRPTGAQLAGYNGQKNPFAAHFFNPDFIRSYRNWWRELLTTPDPTTGKPLTSEPAVATVELVNEDSYFFWTFTPYENVPAEQMAILEKQFGDALAQKYGTVQAAFQTWAGSPVKGDNAPQGRAGFRALWELFSSRDARSKDTAAFLAQSQRKWFDDQMKYVRGLGFKGLVIGSNWITADPKVLGPLDKWSNTVADIMDHHGYFDLGHEGEAASYSIRKGHKFIDASALTFPNNNISLPIFDVIYNGKPSVISEINWTSPNRLRADLPLVAAAYGALQGTDALYFFAGSAPSWESSIAKFGIRTPVIAGQYPAAALMYRKGLIKPGPVAVHANVSMRALFNLDGAPILAPKNLDQLRAADVPANAQKTERLEGMDPLAFLVGKVAMDFTPTDQPSETIALGKFIDHEHKTVRSATGELLWDYGNGIVKVDAPQVQGITGFLSKSKLETSAFTADLPIPYGALIAVSLDDKPIAQSGKILVQVMSQESMYGFRTAGTNPYTIEDLGSAPIAVQKLRGSFAFRRPDQAQLKVTALDFNGYPVKTLPKGATVQLLPDVIYYLVEK